MDAIMRSAIHGADDHVLSHVHQAPGQVSPASAVRSAVSARPLRAPCVEMKYSSTFQAFVEVRLDRRESMIRPERVGHEAAHASQLRNLLDRTSRFGVGHHVIGLKRSMRARWR